jgi:glycosyltransferase involved in cell wall biosynthesis
LPERVASVVVCKPEDRRYFRGGDVAVVPNGALAPAMLPNEDDVADDVLFVGNLEYLPNIDAVRHFAHDVLPLVHRRRPSTRFVVAGRNPGPDVKALHDGSGVVVHDTPPDLECLYASAAIVVVPMRMGGGTRIKTIEAMMWAKSVVTTPAGREGIDARPGIDLLEASTPEAFADACVSLLDDAERRRALGASARSRTLHRYHWDRSVEEAERLVERVARAGPDVPR